MYPQPIIETSASTIVCAGMSSRRSMLKIMMPEQNEHDKQFSSRAEPWNTIQ